jgi:hypothetical protein
MPLDLGVEVLQHRVDVPAGVGVGGAPNKFDVLL